MTVVRSQLVELVGPLTRRYLARFGRRAQAPLAVPMLPGFDLQLVPARSVSVLWAAALVDGAGGVARAVWAVQHAGIAEAVAYLERELATELAAVGFDHRYASSGDPLLHTHLILGLVAQAAGQRWAPLDAARLIAAAPAAIAVYDVTIRRTLAATIDVQWVRHDQVGSESGPGAAPWEVAGMPAAAVALWSTPCRPLTDVGWCR